MKVKILEKTDDSVLLEVEGENHTFANLLRSTLLEDKNTLDIAYFIKHPELDPPRVFLRTTGKQSPIKVLRTAAKTLQENLSELRTQLRAEQAKSEKK